MIISIDGERTFDKIQHFFMVIACKKQRTKENYNIIKVIYEKPTPNIMLTYERLKYFPPM